MSTEPVVPTAAETAQFLPIPPAMRPYQGRRAGIVSRILANVIDAMFVVAVLAVVYLAVCGVWFIINPAGFHFPIPPRWLGFTVAGVVLVGYFAVSWVTTGRTYGDQVLGLRVVDRHGRRLHPVMAVVRALFCTVFLVGILWVAVSPRRRSIQDLVLRTAVIYDWIPDSVADGASMQAKHGRPRSPEPREVARPRSADDGGNPG
jgi:uncharacterized RDD family membrane protein YckC